MKQIKSSQFIITIVKGKVKPPISRELNQKPAGKGAGFGREMENL
jgi:hypothetical protein